MKKIIKGLQKAFDHRVRLGTMSILMVNDWVDFTSLRDTLEVTDGNLASHLRALEQMEYIAIKKEFVGRKPRTTYQATPAGKKAFNDHLDQLERILKMRDPT